MPVDTISEPRYITELVTDYDLVLSCGREAGYILRQGDSRVETDDRITVTIQERPGLSIQELATFYKLHVASESRRVRAERRLDVTEPPVDLTPADPEVPSTSPTPRRGRPRKVKTPVPSV